MNKKLFNLDAFTLGYIACALWSSVDDNAIPLDREFTIEDFTDSAIGKMVRDCALFQTQNDLTNYPLDEAGHDFWLSRNGHGAGFWENDHGTRPQCVALHEAACAFGTCDVETITVWKSKIRGKTRLFV